MAALEVKGKGPREDEKGMKELNVHSNQTEEGQNKEVDARAWRQGRIQHRAGAP